MIDYIDSRSNKKVKYAKSLTIKKYREEFHEFLSEGFKNLELAIQSGLLKSVFATSKIKGIPEGVEFNLVKEDVLEYLAESKSPEGVVFICAIPEHNYQKSMQKLVYLDELNDPGNVGTILRTALAFGFDGVVVSPNTVDLYNPKVVAASKGAIYMIPTFRGELEEYKDDRAVIVSALHAKSIELKKVKKSDRIILVIGSESHGVRESVLAQADVVTKIEIDNIESLNASVAAAILMYELK